MNLDKTENPYTEWNGTEYVTISDKEIFMRRIRELEERVTKIENHLWEKFGECP